MTGAELAPLELAGRLALALGLAVFLGLAFEEVYKRESTPGGVRTFPMRLTRFARVHCWAGRAGNLAARLLTQCVAQPEYNKPNDSRLESACVSGGTDCSHPTTLAGSCRFGASLTCINFAVSNRFIVLRGKRASRQTQR
jgi:hypothetical protein